MRRFQVVYRPEARDDLANIFRFILKATQSVPVARGFVERIKARCDRIGDAPLAGRPRDDLEPGLRTVPFETSTVVAYCIDGTKVRIINVFYGGRD